MRPPRRSTSARDSPLVAGPGTPSRPRIVGMRSTLRNCPRIRVARGEDARPGEDEGDAQGRFVDEQEVLVLAMVAQALAVVRGHHHERARAQVRPVELLEEATELSVGVGHLSIVGSLCELPVVGWGRLVGIVWIEEVGPDEEGRRGPSLPRKARAASTTSAAGRSMRPLVGRSRRGRRTARSRGRGRSPRRRGRRR